MRRGKNAIPCLFVLLVHLIPLLSFDPTTFLVAYMRSFDGCKPLLSSNKPTQLNVQLLSQMGVLLVEWLPVTPGLYILLWSICGCTKFFCQCWLSMSKQQAAFLFCSHLQARPSGIHGVQFCSVLPSTIHAAHLG